MSKNKGSLFLGVVLVGLLMLAVTLLAVGCQQRTDQKLVPEKPDQTLGDEPVITLYQHESDETVSVPLEEYLCGVVAAEMAVDWPAEALAAQAIMARTFTLEKLAAGGVEARGTDASTDIKEFQAYDASKVNEAVRAAVQNTRGQVVQYQGAPIKAWFFADGGGATAASALEGLGYSKTATPYIHSVADPGETLADNPNGHWEAVFPLAEVSQAVAEISGQAVSSIEQVTVAEKGPSGRVTKLQCDQVVVSAPALRLALDSTAMKSTLLTGIKVRDGQVHMTGQGYGHGVGLSQWGARAMAEQGAHAAEIIHYFLKDVTIDTLYR